MGHGLLHQSNTSGRIGAVLARSKDSHGLGEKVGVGAITLRGDARRDQADLLYLEIRRGTQVAQGRGLQNLHSWVRIPPAPPSFSFQINGLQLSSLSRNPRFAPTHSVWSVGGRSNVCITTQYCSVFSRNPRSCSGVALGAATSK